jgi:hypothetical protein
MVGTAPRRMLSMSCVACMAIAAASFAACGSGSSSQAAHDADAATTSDGESPSDAASSDGAGDAPSLLGDGALTDQATACTHLNIGILGIPGANPSSNFQQWLINAGTTVNRIQTTATDTLTAAELQPFDVVVLDWLTRDYTTVEAATFATWVSAGGGVASMSGYDNDPSNDWRANSLLAPLEVAYGGGDLLNGPVTDFAAFPITMGITSVTFNGGWPIQDLGGTASVRTPIAFLQDPEAGANVPVGYAVVMSSGHAFVWGDEWIEFDSEWTTLPQIKQLWVQIFAWLAGKNKCMLQPTQ